MREPILFISPAGKTAGDSFSGTNVATSGNGVSFRCRTLPVEWLPQSGHNMLRYDGFTEAKTENVRKHRKKRFSKKEKIICEKWRKRVDKREKKVVIYASTRKKAHKRTAGNEPKREVKKVLKKNLKNFRKTLDKGKLNVVR